MRVSQFPVVLSFEVISDTCNVSFNGCKAVPVITVFSYSLNISLSRIVINRDSFLVEYHREVTIE